MKTRACEVSGRLYVIQSECDTFPKKMEAAEFISDLKITESFQDIIDIENIEEDSETIKVTVPDQVAKICINFHYQVVIRVG